MAQEQRFRIGAEATCPEGACGRVTRVVMDPVARSVTHLVIQPKHWQQLSRLVPVDLVEDGPGEVWLRCNRAEFDELDAAEEIQFLPDDEGGDDRHAGYTPEQAAAWPLFGLASGGMRGADIGLGGMGLGPRGLMDPVTHEAIPAGEVTVRRGEHVHTTDGDIGRVQGLVVDPRNHHVTHVLLQEGHLWGRKQVTIPIGAVDRVDGGIWLKISKTEVQNLPAVDIEHPTQA